MINTGLRLLVIQHRYLWRLKKLKNIHRKDKIIHREAFEASPIEALHVEILKGMCWAQILYKNCDKLHLYKIPGKDYNFYKN